jgi:hypothetical protein
MPDHYEDNIELDIDETPQDDVANASNEPTLEQLKKNLEDADTENSEHVTNVSRWLSNLFVTGPAKITTPKGHSEIQPKLIRKQAEWRYSSLSEPFLSTPDIFNVYPVTAGDKNRAEQNALVLNHQFNRKIRKVAFIDEYVRDAVDVGTVAVKVGWESEEEEITKEEPVIEYILEPTGRLAERYQWLLELKAQDPEAYLDYDRPGLEQALEMFMTSGQAYMPQETGEFEEVTRTVETKNQPTVETLDTRNLIIPPCGGDYEKAAFIAEKYKSSRALLKKNGNFFNLDKIMEDAASPISSPDYEDEEENNSFNFDDKTRKQFVVHEYWGLWDIHNDGTLVPIVVAWVDNVIVRMQENPFPDRKPPYVFATYMPKRRSVFGTPDGELLEDNQKVVGAVTRGMIDLMARSANGQTGIRSDMLTVANRRKFIRGEDYEFNNTVDPRQGIYHHEYPEIPGSAYNMITMMNNEAESLSGVKAFTNTGITGDALGKAVSSGRSALDAASKREIGILRRLGAGIEAIGRKFISMNAEFLSDEEVVRITADNYVTVRRDDLEGEFDLDLAISTPEEDNRKAEELAFMLQTDTNNADPEERRLIRAEIARLRKMPGLAKRIEEYQPTPDPLAVKEQELKIVLLEAQIAKEEALANKHNAEAIASGGRGYKDETQGDLNRAKSGESMAKARDYHSTADNKDLDFLEQQSGVHQARELEKTAVTEKLKNQNKPTPAQSKK